MPDETLPKRKTSKTSDTTLEEQILEKLEHLPPQTPVQVARGEQWRLTKGGILVVRDHYSVMPDRDPEQNPEWKKKERRKYTSQAAWDREQEIIDEAGGGERVFADILLTYWDKIVIQDSDWEPDPEWDVVSGGFDHGKTNPTCLERAFVDFDGTIIFAGEYYQPGREIWQHAPAMKRMIGFEQMQNIQADPSMFHGTNQQEQRPGHSQERAKSFAELYADKGVTNLVPFGGDDRSDVSFAARLLMHWSDLDHRMPSVRIVCRKGLYQDKPQPGLKHWDCPNLLWELMAARRVKLTAQQLLTRNLSEAIVDKDNHARDAMKYFIMSRPEPSRKSLERRVDERVQEARDQAKRQGATDDEAATNAVLQHTKIMHEEAEQENPSTYYGRNGRRLVDALQRQINRQYARRFRYLR
jgi:hypothetical protein